MTTFTKTAQLGGLVITRREAQQVVINHGELRIEVVEVRGKYVRLAFLGHPEIVIERAEAVNKNDCNFANDRATLFPSKKGDKSHA